MPEVALVSNHTQLPAAIALLATVTEVPVVVLVTVCELTLVVVETVRLDPLMIENVTLGVLAPVNTTVTELIVIAEAA